MPIDLPPVLPPQFGDADVLEERHEWAPKQQTIEVQVGTTTMLVDGNTYLSEARIRNAAALVDSPSKFILLLNALYAAEGYQLVNVEYARNPDTRDIYVHVSEGYLDEVNAPPMLAPYFDRFEDRRGLKESDFESMRVLAEIKAERAGLKVSTNYEVSKTQPESFTLSLEAEPDPEHDAVDVTTVFGNPGNRFLGRYFGFTKLQFYTPDGDVIGFDYSTAFTGLGDDRGGERYDRGSLSYATVNTYGLYSLSASYTEYQLGDRFGLQETEEAEIVQGGLEGTQFLYATDKTRWLLSEKLEYTDSIIEFADAPMTTTLDDGTVFPIEGQRAQDERYAAFRLGTTLSRGWRLFGQPGSLRIDGRYKRGFAGEIDNLVNTRREPDFNLFAGELALSYRMFFNVVAALRLEGQRTVDSELPQQEQWVLGGPDRLSAFLPGILTGDKGSYGRFSLRLPAWQQWGSRTRLSLFVEGGTAAFENRTGSEAAVGAVADAGVKLEFAMSEWLEVTAHTANSLGERNMEIFPGAEFVEDNKADFFFSVKLKL